MITISSSTISSTPALLSGHHHRHPHTPGADGRVPLVSLAQPVLVERERFRSAEDLLFFIHLDTPVALEALKAMGLRTGEVRQGAWGIGGRVDQGASLWEASSYEVDSRRHCGPDRRRHKCPPLSPLSPLGDRGGDPRDPESAGLPYTRGQAGLSRCGLPAEMGPTHGVLDGVQWVVDGWVVAALVEGRPVAQPLCKLGTVDRL
jgi:hypothetical protein